MVGRIYVQKKGNLLQQWQTLFVRAWSTRVKNGSYNKKIPGNLRVQTLYPLVWLLLPKIKRSNCVSCYLIWMEHVLVHLLEGSHFISPAFPVDSPHRYNRSSCLCLLCVFTLVCAGWRCLAVSSSLRPVYRQYTRYLIHWNITHSTSKTLRVLSMV